MAPVVNIPANNKLGPEKPKKPIERKSELICRVKYSNNMPDIPFDPKFISYPFDTNRFIQYKQTSLEKNFKHELLTELDLGVNIDLINPETYEPPEQGTLKIDEEDDRLLEDEATAKKNTKRSRCHNRAVTWLKKTEYIATEFNRYGTSNEKTETKVGFGVKKKMDMIDYVGRDGQISAVNRTFEAAKMPIVAHPEKPGVKPVEIMPVFPDFDLWKFPFAQVMFDAEPHKSEEYMSEAVLRGHSDNVVMYFVPTEATLEKRKKDEEEGRDYIWEEEYEYIKAHEYNCKITNTHTQNKKELIENYFFIWRDNEVVYNELETRINLTKLRVKQIPQGVSLLAIKHRDLNETEDNCFSTRLEKIEPKKKKEEIEAAEKAEKGEHEGEDEQKEEDVEMKDAGEERAADNEDEDEDEDEGQESGNSDDKSSSEKNDKSDDESEDDSDSESEGYRKKKDSEQYSKARGPTRKPGVAKSDSEKSSSAASSAASGSSSSSSESEEASSASSSDDDDENGGDRQRQRQSEQKKSKKKMVDIFGSDSDN